MLCTYRFALVFFSDCVVGFPDYEWAHRWLLPKSAHQALLSTPDQDARGENERAAEDDLKRRHEEAHVEVAVADEGDGE